MKRLLSLAIIIPAIFSLGAVFGTPGSQVKAETLQAAEETRMLSMVNNHRASRGLPPLQMNEALRGVARRHTQRMVQAGNIYHNPNLAADADQAVPGWKLIGENVGVGASTDSVQQAFLNSPRHRDNIETGRFKVVGIGAYSTPDGEMYFTQNFADWTGSPPPAQPQAAPQAPAQPVQPAAVAAPEPAAPKPVRAVAPAKPAQPAKLAAPEAAPPSADPGPQAEGDLPSHALDGDAGSNSSDGPLGTPAEPRGPAILATLLSLVATFVTRIGFWIN